MLNFSGCFSILSIQISRLLLHTVIHTDTYATDWLLFVRYVFFNFNEQFSPYTPYETHPTVLAKLLSDYDCDIFKKSLSKYLKVCDVLKRTRQFQTHFIVSFPERDVCNHVVNDAVSMCAHFLSLKTQIKLVFANKNSPSIKTLNIIKFIEIWNKVSYLGYVNKKYYNWSRVRNRNCSWKQFWDMWGIAPGIHVWQGFCAESGFFKWQSKCIQMQWPHKICLSL